MVEMSWPTISTEPCTLESMRYFLPVFLATAAMTRSIGTPSLRPVESAELSAAALEPALRPCALATSHVPTKHTINKIAQPCLIFVSYLFKISFLAAAPNIWPRRAGLAPPVAADYPLTAASTPPVHPRSAASQLPVAWTGPDRRA